MTNGTLPSGSCSAARSASHELSSAAVSYSRVAVAANTWMSPVQPSRSSRCGQSVGTSRKLPRMPHTMFSWSWLTRGSEHANQPVRTMSECSTTAVMCSGRNSPGQPLTPA